MTEKMPPVAKEGDEEAAERPADGDALQRSVDRDDVDAVARNIEAYYRQNPLDFGAADIFGIGAATGPARAAIIATSLCAFVGKDDRKPVIRRFLIVAPPESDTDAWLVEYWGQFRRSFALLAGWEMEADEDSARRSHVKVVAAADMRSSSIVDLISQQADRTAIILCQASIYRDPSISAYISPGLNTPAQEEDFWVPQLHGLVVQSMEAIKDRELYVAIDTGEFSPRREPLQDLLKSIDNCGVMGSSSAESPEHIIADRLDQWERWAAEGRVGRALQDLDSLPAKFDPHRTYLRIQLLNRAGLSVLALQLIRDEIASGKVQDPYTRAKLARIAEDANASRLAADLLEPAIGQLNTREYLETAYRVAQDTGIAELEEKVAARIEALYPGDLSVARRRFERLVADCDYAAAADVAHKLLNDEAAASFCSALDRHLLAATVPDYSALIAEAGEDQRLAEAFRMASVEDARLRGLPVHALDLALPLPTLGGMEARGERLLAGVLKDLALIAGSNGAWPVPRERLREPLLALLKRLADNPGNRSLRVELAELFEPGVSGTEGLTLLVFLIFETAGLPVGKLPSKIRGKKDMVWLLEKKDLLRSLFEWIKSEEPAILGRLTAPREILIEAPDDIVSGLADYLDLAPMGTAGDENAQMSYLLMASAVTPHSSDPDFDLELLRLVAGKFASSGLLQSSRDLVEQALLNGTGTPQRRRLAWFAVADTYTRLPNLVEAGIALACAWLAHDEAEREQIIQELNTLARLMREFGLFDSALDAVARARPLIGELGLSESYGFQLDTLELQIRHRMLRSADDADTIARLLADTVPVAKATLDRNAMPGPIAAMLGQLLRHARGSGAAIPAEADELFSNLIARTQGSVREMLTGMAADHPTSAQIETLVRAAGPSRYSADMGFDIRNIAIVASRALADDAVLQQPEETSFLLDLGSDLGVASPNWDEAAAPPPLPAIGDTADIALGMSKTGISVVQAGFDENGRLVRIAAVDGALQPPVREADEVINEKRLKAWSQEFPYAYGIDETTANLFYTTTADLRFSALPAGPTLLVAEAGLQVFPPNLLFVDNEFAGRTRPMAAAPSLAWLGAARKMGSIGDGRMCAWISTAADGESQTLSMIAERLEGTFDEHGFVVDNGPTLPAGFAGSTLAVVTAHGGISKEDGYFQMVSDEGVLRVTSGELANALRNVGVVILFVCSGGRSDKHPGANTTLGLAKQILDRGGTAVIASPWPLDAVVPSHWLPAFLDHWTKGARLIEACFEANKLVDVRFATDPARGLAMTLVGNPEILFKPASG